MGFCYSSLLVGIKMLYFTYFLFLQKHSFWSSNNMNMHKNIHNYANISTHPFSTIQNWLKSLLSESSLSQFYKLNYYVTHAAGYEYIFSSLSVLVFYFIVFKFLIHLFYLGKQSCIGTNICVLIRDFIHSICVHPAYSHSGWTVYFMHYVIYIPCVVGIGGWSTTDLISFQHNLTKIIIGDIYWDNKIENEKWKPRKNRSKCVRCKV